MTPTQQFLLAVLAILLVVSAVIAGIEANKAISLNRHDAIVSCIDEGRPPLDCREALR